MFEIKSQVTVKILGYFFLNRNKQNYINELAKILEIDPGNIDKKLKELEREGILASELRGNQKYYFLNKDFSLLKEVERLYNFKYGFGKIIADAIMEVDGVKEVYIFGSYAKGGFGDESDIDLLLVGDQSAIGARKKLAKIEKQIGREINIVNLTKKELIKKKSNKDEFISNIFANKIIKIL
ncbi:nucleotidyltransferase domain-containing protein [Candidatus Parcubacteria bacterium]|nr:nucleotidyltransferase domain-containing protein [Patescibacteria group bacterium]MBU4309847.1 nucleotidyltransferase domain-containing protein [Patescibacteria group bacterium]MBU4431742.1 nucleotidyltransferase domain-containing protein [Patescibacteria group bacterium]MBU4578186.1 nucleotidyltransferase domain-containing protein [Patescibacteria group bacterium]MCG2696722.1 nucleotidyltransferase domain-containing protein [Candidatus Parcubacteria bacterium]